jgi:hypothetical protein
MAVHLIIAQYAKDVMGKISSEVEVGFPPFSVKINFEGLRDLQVDVPGIHLTLQRCFVQRRLFNMSMDAEALDFVLISAKEIYKMLQERADSLSKLGGSNRVPFKTILAWESATNKLIQNIRDRISEVGAVTVASADAKGADAIRQYRIQALPLVDVLISVLPENDRPDYMEPLGSARNQLEPQDRVAVLNAVTAE